MRERVQTCTPMCTLIHAYTHTYTNKYKTTMKKRELYETTRVSAHFRGSGKDPQVNIIKRPHLICTNWKINREKEIPFFIEPCIWKCSSWLSNMHVRTMKWYPFVLATRLQEPYLFPEVLPTILLSKLKSNESPWLNIYNLIMHYLYQGFIKCLDISNIPSK